MSKHTIKGFVTYQKDPWEDSPMYQIWPFDMSKTCTDRPLVVEMEFEVEIPDDFNPVPQMVAALEEQKRQERLKLAQKLAELDEKIAKLTCIEHTVVEA